jgi:hypothetical protein
VGQNGRSLAQIGGLGGRSQERGSSEIKTEPSSVTSTVSL